MSPETYKSLLEHPENLHLENVSDLRSIIDKYPYFQSARALYLKGLKNTESFRYNSELKLTAAHTSDRAVLFDYITSEVFEEKKTIHQELQAKISSGIATETIEDSPANEEEAALGVGTPIQFTSNERHSFSEWLQLSAQKPAQRTQKSSKESKRDIIDRFIKSQPKITPVNKDQEVGLSIAKNKTDKSLMTETLAKVYLEQKKYTKAVKAYEILSLKYPEKSGFFADQIKRIKILKQKKS